MLSSIIVRGFSVSLEVAIWYGDRAFGFRPGCLNLD
jgi:hypothetical protein